MCGLRDAYVRSSSRARSRHGDRHVTRHLMFWELLRMPRGTCPIKCHNVFGSMCCVLVGMLLNGFLFLWRGGEGICK